MITKKPELVNLLLDFGASLSVQNRRGHNSFHVAVLTGAIECLRVLINRFTDIADLQALDFEGTVFCVVLLCVCITRFLFVIHTNSAAMLYRPITMSPGSEKW